MSGAESPTEPGTETDTHVERESFVGSGLERVEDHRILTGEAEYIHDIEPENTVHMALVRSVHPHAHVEDVDTSAAEDHPDCLLALTVDTLKEEYEPMPCGLKGFEEWSLADDKVRFVGEPVVAVVAKDRYAAEDIVDLVDIEYDQLDPVVDPLDAREDETLVHEHFGSNVADSETLDFGDVEGAFEEADNVIEREYSWGRISGVPLETAGVVATYDPDHDAFDIDCNIQLHTLVDDTIYEPLGYPPEKVNLEVPPDVGGSFGTKIAIHRYCTLAAMASQQLDGRPVKFVEDRIENLQGGDMHSSDRDYRVRLAYDDDGTIRGLDTWFVDDFGAFPHYPVNQALKPLSVVTNAYDIENVRYDYEIALTNKTAQTAYRGFGVPPHLHALEMVVDEAARELGVEATDLRRLNLIQPDDMPFRLPTHNIYDSGDFPAALDRIEEIVEEREVCEGGLLDPDVVEQKREEGKYRGYSPTVHIEPGVSGSDWTDRQRTDKDALEARDREDVSELPEHFRIELMEDGTVQSYLATDTSGQGHQTLVTQLLADGLGVLPSDIEVGYLDSVTAPTEYGTAASRMAVMLSGATEGAAQKLRENCRKLAAQREFGCDVDDVVYRDGGVERADGSERLTLAELAELDSGQKNERLTRVSYDYEHPTTSLPEFDEALTRKFPVYPTAAFAANAPIVEVDTDTGEVDILKFYSLRDCGTRLNPTIVDGQAHGGLAQGLGAALMEEFEYDDEGQPQAITMFEYLLPSTKNMPDVELEHSETPSPFTATGAKGTGEGGMIDGPAAIASSINAALADQGIVADQIPMTPHRVRKRLRDGE
ncbi:xanthine dehydrogenase family protein molybdopterin-binding subunit [Halobacterium wangiae]|uniref:xanthine dehydrogenase family protein molybdopterin-binding subunit n=1 Tax=Halobacterium wangiae TaxID=2902623 RepID=UPI001E39FFB3|nr:xanthine dehydrogenase family protein molybdopterin-binding subunit [Halobacterium wangiae]